MRGVLSHLRALLTHVPAPVLIVGAALSAYSGAAFAVMIFSVLEPGVIAWLRVFIAGIFLCMWRRPWRAGLRWRDLLESALFGLSLLAMNVAFYESIDYLPMGAAVSMEFIGPVVVAVVRGRGLAPRVAAVLAMAGVVAIGGLGLDLSDPRTATGIKWAALTAAAWAIYILLGQRVASKRSGVTNLAVGCALSGLIVSPFVFPQALPAFAQPRILGIIVIVAVLSTVVPCSFEAIAMHRVSAADFSLISSLSPASSLVVGIIILGQLPTMWQLVGLFLISFAVAIASRHGTKDHTVLAEEVQELVEGTL